MRRFTLPFTYLFNGLSAVAILVAAIATVSFADGSKIPQTEVRLEPSGAEAVAHDQFGAVTAMSANGNTLAVAGPTTDDGGISEVGAVFIFERVQNNWVQTARLFPGDAIEDETFAFNVAISEDGNTVIVDGLDHNGLFRNQGAVYVYQRSNGVWTQQAELLSPTPGNQTFFGSWGLSISGNTIAAGDLGNAVNGFTPGIDVFTLVNGVWQLSATVQLPDDFDFSPASVSLSGNTLAVGTGADGSVPGGLAYVFGISNGTWTLQAKLAASDPSFGSRFGSIVQTDGNNLLVGAPQALGNGIVSGAAYVFTKRGGGWSQQAKLIAADGVFGDSFGAGVALSGGTAAIGAINHATNAGPAGTVYLYALKEGTWAQFAEIAGSDVAAGGQFGTSVALETGSLFVGLRVSIRSRTMCRILRAKLTFTKSINVRSVVAALRGSQIWSAACANQSSPPSYRGRRLAFRAAGGSPGPATRTVKAPTAALLQLDISGNMAVIRRGVFSKTARVSKITMSELTSPRYWSASKSPPLVNASRCFFTNRATRGSLAKITALG